MQRCHARVDTGARSPEQHSGDAGDAGGRLGFMRSGFRLACGCWRAGGLWWACPRACCVVSLRQVAWYQRGRPENLAPDEEEHRPRRHQPARSA